MKKFTRPTGRQARKAWDARSKRRNGWMPAFAAATASNSTRMFK